MRAQGLHPDMVFTGELPIDEAARLIERLQKSPESAIVAAVLGWKYTPTGAERAAWDIAEMKFNSQRKKGTVPVRLTRPWHGTPDVPTPKLVPQDSPERLAALERLQALS